MVSRYTHVVCVVPDDSACVGAQWPRDLFVGPYCRRVCVSSRDDLKLFFSSYQIEYACDVSRRGRGKSSEGDAGTQPSLI